MLVFERGVSAGDLEPEPSGRELAPDLVALARQVSRKRDPLVRQLIARAHINDYAHSQLNQRVAGLMRMSKGMNPGIAAYGKLAMGTFLPIRARIGMEIGRGHAVLWEAGEVDRMAPALNYLNGRIASIAGGTNEMQRNGRRRVLRLPRGPLRHRPPLQRGPPQRPGRPPERAVTEPWTENNSSGSTI